MLDNFQAGVVGVFLAILLYKLLYRLFGRLFYVKNIENRAVFLSGCDSGFGYAAALKFADLGVVVFAGCFTEAGESRLRKADSRIFPLQLDVTKDESVQKAKATVLARLKQLGNVQLWAVVNNAGKTELIAPDDWTSVSDYEKIMNINFYGYKRVVDAFKTELKCSQGRIILISSIQSRFIFPFKGPYCLSKVAVEAYADLIRRELFPFQIGVSVIEPGGFQTEHVGYIGDRVKKQVIKLWNQQSEALKAEYGTEYFQYFVDFCENYDKFPMVHDISPVVQAYCEAALSRFPRYRYVIGWDCWREYLPMSWMSEWIQDYYCKRRILKNVPLPAAARVE